MNYKILIATISLLVFAIIGASLWIGIAMREATVVEHPYEAGLRYEATQKRYAELGWRIVVPPSVGKGGQLDVYVYDKNGAAMDTTIVECIVNRIGSSDMKKYRAEHADHGRYRVHADFSSTGYWELQVNVTQGTDTLRYDSKIHIDG
jgi:nitrogen fixation protein FixH